MQNKLVQIVKVSNIAIAIFIFSLLLNLCIGFVRLRSWLLLCIAPQIRQY